jgi:hypothetical protein
MRMKSDKMKKIIFSKLWKYVTYCKVESIHLQTKCLEMYAWIKSGVVMKEAFKDWKTLLTSTPQEKGWSFLIN